MTRSVRLLQCAVKNLREHPPCYHPTEIAWNANFVKRYNRIYTMRVVINELIKKNKISQHIYKLYFDNRFFNITLTYGLLIKRSKNLKKFWIQYAEPLGNLIESTAAFILLMITIYHSLIISFTN